MKNQIQNGKSMMIQINNYQEPSSTEMQSKLLSKTQETQHDFLELKNEMLPDNDCSVENEPVYKDLSKAARSLRYRTSRNAKKAFHLSDRRLVVNATNKLNRV